MYATQDFVSFIDFLRAARTPSDVLNAWNVLEASYESLRVITILPDYQKNVYFPGTDIRDLAGKKIVTPYFLGDALYFSSRRHIEKTFIEKKINVSLDSSIMLDTNIASYISTYINRRPFDQKKQAEIVNLLRQLLELNPNFDYNYYLIENSKEILTKYDAGYRPTPDELWEDIGFGFRENLIALKQFVSIDREKFRTSGDDTPTISIGEAIAQAKDHVHVFYFGNDEAILKELKSRFLFSRILLYKMAAIHFESHEGVKKKTIKFIQFMIDKLQKYFDREMHIAIRYFKEGKKFSFFEKLDIHPKIELAGLRKTVENMAWDLMIPRIMESLSATFGEGEFFIPHCLSWDKGLNESLNMYKAKACIYDDSLGRVVTISGVDTKELLQQTIGDHANKYFDSEVVAQRSKAAKLTDDNLAKILSNVELELLSVICK